LRVVVRGLVLPGQRRVHMKTERDSRRREIAAALVAAGVRVVVYDAARRYSTDLVARRECLHAVVTDAAAAQGETRLVLEQDDSLVSWDSQRLIESARATGLTSRSSTQRAPPMLRVGGGQGSDMRAPPGPPRPTGQLPTPPTGDLRNGPHHRSRARAGRTGTRFAVRQA